MVINKLKSLEDCFSLQPFLKSILKAAKRQQVLNELLQKLLPTHLQSAVTAETLKGEVLNLSCDNACIATELKLLSQNIIKDLRALPEFCGLTQLKIKIIRPVNNQKTQKAQTSKLSINEASMQSLTNIASGIKDQNLKNAMLKLANKN